MKISNSKRQLAKLLIEAGVTQFPDGANWAAQDKDKSLIESSPLSVMFYNTKPPRPQKGYGYWCATVPLSELVGKPVKLSTLIPNWHQTALSRDEFDQIVAETVVHGGPDSDGWIEWNGGECPVGEGDRIDVKFSDGDEFFDVGSDWDWGVDAGSCNIIAYRLHKPEKSLEELCGEVKEENKHEHIEAKPTIEQLAADYHNAKDCADRKQQEADAAKADADARLAELVTAGEALGLFVSPITTKQESELAIGIKVGDEVECIKSIVYPDKYVGKVGTVFRIDDSSPAYLVDFGGKKVWCHYVKFIRRP